MQTLTQSPQEKKNSAKKRFNRKVYAVTLGLILFVALVGALWKWVPGWLSPPDLEVGFDNRDYQSLLDKLGMQVDPAPSAPGGDYDLAFGEPVDFSTSLTPAELTAYFNFNRPGDAVVEQAQVDIQSDGTLELSGKLRSQAVMPYVQEYLEEATLFLPDVVSVYIKCQIEVVDGRATFIPKQAKISGIDVPTSMLENKEIRQGFEQVANENLCGLAHDAPFTIRQLYCKDGLMYIAGTAPSTVSYIAKNA